MNIKVHKVSGFKLDLHAWYAHGTAGRTWFVVVLVVFSNACFLKKLDLIMLLNIKMSEESIFQSQTWKFFKMLDITSEIF